MTTKYQKLRRGFTIFFRVFSILFVALCVVVALVCFTPLGLVVAVGSGGLVAKWELDNPYVNARFRDWKPVAIHGEVSVRIPEDWTFQEEDGTYTILDADGTVWAYGFCSERDGARDALVESLYGFTPDAYTSEAYPCSGYMELGEMEKVWISGENACASYDALILRNGLQDSVYLIPTARLEENPEQYDIAEAILYSYAWTFD